MELDELTQKLTAIFPKPLLVVVLLLGAIAFMMILNRPHTICDTARETFLVNQKGILLPIKEGKYTYPGTIIKSMESCRLGDSGGACYEYLNILRKAAGTIKNAPGECLGTMMGIPIGNYERAEYYTVLREGDREREELARVEYGGVSLQRVFEDGIEMLVRKAWGLKPPEPGPMRMGWLAETEIAVFCHIQDVVRRAKGQEGWAAFQKKIYEKLPGEEVPEPLPGSPRAVPRPATMMFNENDLRQRTIFSVNCGSYR